MNGVRFPGALGGKDGQSAHPSPRGGRHQDTYGTVVNEINHSILQLKYIYIISYLKGVCLTSYCLEHGVENG